MDPKVLEPFSLEHNSVVEVEGWNEVFDLTKRAVKHGVSVMTRPAPKLRKRTSRRKENRNTEWDLALFFDDSSGRAFGQMG